MAMAYLTGHIAAAHMFRAGLRARESETGRSQGHERKEGRMGDGDGEPLTRAVQPPQPKRSSWAFWKRFSRGGDIGSVENSVGAGAGAGKQRAASREQRAGTKAGAGAGAGAAEAPGPLGTGSVFRDIADAEAFIEAMRRSRLFTKHSDV